MKNILQSRVAAVATGAFILIAGAGMGGTAAWAATSGDSLVQNTVDTTEVQNGTLTGTDVRDGSLGTADVGNGSLTGADIRDGSLGHLDIADGHVGSPEIADGSITAADLRSDVRQQIADSITSVRTIVEFEGPNGARGTINGNGMATLSATVPAGGDAVRVVARGDSGTVLLECVAVPTELGGSCSASGMVPPTSFTLESEGGSAHAKVTGVATR